jgi:ATP synthase protein I
VVATRRRSEARTWLDLSIVGIQFPVAILIGYFFGRWLDGQFGTGMWLTLVFLIFGVAAGFRNLFKITAQAERDEAARERQREAEGGDEP